MSAYPELRHTAQASQGEANDARDTGEQAARRRNEAIDLRGAVDPCRSRHQIEKVDESR
jgi:hypothetical protein